MTMARGGGRVGEGQTVRAREPNWVEQRLGDALQWAIQRWVRWTGRTVRLPDALWLAGPTGTSRIGHAIYRSFATEAGLEALDGEAASAEAAIRGRSAPGLLADFGSLRGDGFEPDAIDSAVRRFYEETAAYGLDAWAAWSGPLRPFAQTLVYLVSRNIEQLNLPRSPLEVSRGMTNDIVLLRDPATGEIAYGGWLRTSAANGRVIYAGFYTTCQPPLATGPCVKVVFPLPSGSATFVLRPERAPDGSLVLLSDGKRFGEPGAYRIHRVGPEAVRVKFVPVKERIHVYRDPRDPAILRTDHIFRFWRFRWLTLHYKIARRSDNGDTEYP
jgi:hypothetical protein